MNTLWIVLIAVVVISMAYNLYAKRVDRNIIQSDAKRATRARQRASSVARRTDPAEPAPPVHVAGSPVEP